MTIKAAISAAAAALATPAMLFAGAGTAQASPELSVWTVPTLGGVNVFVKTADGPDGLSGTCAYTSTVQGDPVGKPVPVFGVPFTIPTAGPHHARLWFPSYQTGSTWNVTVTCPNGVASTETIW